MLLENLLYSPLPYPTNSQNNLQRPPVSTLPLVSSPQKNNSQCTNPNPSSSSPQMSLTLLRFILLLTLTLGSSSSPLQTPHRILADSQPCPLNFIILRKFFQRSQLPNFDVPRKCQYMVQGIRLVESQYLKSTNLFLPPLNTSDSCWSSYQTLVHQFLPNFDIPSNCGFQTSWISQGCMNITSRFEFESRVPNDLLQDVEKSCNQSLLNNSPCAICTTSLSRLRASVLTGGDVGNVTDCTAYPFVYAAGLVNQLGPTDDGTATCLFGFDLSKKVKSHKKNKVLIIVIVLICGFILFGGAGVVWYLMTRRGRWARRRRRSVKIEMAGSNLDSMGASTNLVKFTLDEIKQATRNFSRERIIGRGGYGNVYKGFLADGTEVALKRFKNCSVAGDASFAHEVEVIASVRHVNLVSLIGYCTATTNFEGHQRIIVCELMRNGSLYDHLFGSVDRKLSWPIRQKIALGMARGLAYLHYGAQPAIIHRDIKASNVLLDESFEPKVADFGLAKFTPEGVTHMSTRVAGTMGYVAPEYALYGQLTERSDVYSFGVVLLELLSGKKAMLNCDENQTTLVTDWAWSLVKVGKVLNVIEEGMPELGPPELMEKYVLIAILCSHPQLYARPTMDQLVKLLENDLPVPLIPERPLSIVSNMDDIERSVGSSGSGHLSSRSGYQAFTGSGPLSSTSGHQGFTVESDLSRTEHTEKRNSGSGSRQSFSKN